MKIRGIQIFWVCMIALNLALWVPLLYHESIIFPPTVPQNLEELDQRSEYQVRRLTKSLECRKLPYDNVPEELLELKRVCGVATKIWLKKYRASQIEDLLNNLK